MAEKKYYWLKLKEDFFEEDTLAWIEEQEKGKEYCLFYLKLCLKSLKNEGILIRNVGQLLIPYDAKKLAELTKTDLDTVIVAMELFKKTGLVQVLENGEIYLTKLKTMVGGETSKAEIMRKKRERDKLKPPKNNEKGNNVTNDGNNVTQSSENCYTEKETEKDKDIELDIDKEKEQQQKNLSVVVHSNNEVFKHFQKCGILNSVTTEPKEYSRLMEFIASDIEVFGTQWLMDAADEAVKRGKYKYSYVQGILQNWKSDGRDKKVKEQRANASAYQDFGDSVLDA